jgi:hypothetical protein
MDDQKDRKPEPIPIKDLISEDGAHELATSETMQPYLRLLKAGLQNKDTTPQIGEITALPLEKRYIWRIVSALKWAFADFDNVYVAVDRETLSEEDLGKVLELLRFRPMQLCLFLKALIGLEEMERLMTSAIAVAKQEELVEGKATDIQGREP